MNSSPLERRAGSAPSRTYPAAGGGVGAVEGRVRQNWFLYLFLFLLPLQNIQTGYMPKLPGGLNFLNIGFLLALYGAWRMRGQLAHWSHLHRWVWLYLGWCVVTLFIGFSLVPSNGEFERVNKLKDMAVGIFLLFVVEMSVTDWTSMKRLILTMILPLPYILRVTWSEHASVAGYAYNDDLRISGTFSLLGANEFASFCVTMALVLFAILLASKLSKVWRILLIVGITCMVMGVLWAYSRTSYVTILLGTVVIVLLWRGRLKLAVPVLLAFLIIPPLLPHSVTERFDDTHVEGKQVDESTELRYVYWGVAWQEFLHHPLTGIGYGTFNDASPYGRDTHNFFLRELAEKGLPGFLITFSLLLNLGWVSWRTYRDSPHDTLAYALGLGMCGAWPALMVTNFWGDRFTYAPMIGYYWVFTALCLKGRELALAEKTAAAAPAATTVAIAVPQRYALPARVRQRLQSPDHTTP